MEPRLRGLPAGLLDQPFYGWARAVVTDPARFLLGDRLRDRIEQAIAQCDYLLVIISPNSLKSRWVKLELDSAMVRELENQKIVVIPTLLGGVRTGDLSLDLRGKHCLDFRTQDRYLPNLERLEKLCQLDLEENQKILRAAYKKEADFLFEPWRILWPSEETPELFAYKSPNGADGICRIERINLQNEKVVILCEDINSNPGMSITNCIEYLATQICDQYDIGPEKLVLITHHDTWYSHDNEWVLVSFEQRPPEHIFGDPNWEVMTVEDWRALGFRPRKRRAKDKPSSGVIWYSRR